MTTSSEERVDDIVRAAMGSADDERMVKVYDHYIAQAIVARIQHVSVWERPGPSLRFLVAQANRYRNRLGLELIQMPTEN